MGKFATSLLVFVVLLLLPSCTPTEPIDVARVTATGTAVPSPTFPTISSTNTPQPDTLTPIPTFTPYATVTPTPTTPTPRPTIPAIDLSKTNLNDFAEAGFEQIASAEIDDKSEAHYFAYILQDTALVPFDVNWTTGPEICRIAFFRWQDGKITYLHSFPAPTYPQSDNNFPFDCKLMNWERPIAIDNYLAYAPLWSTFKSEGQKELLGMQSAASDINSNGLPEFAVAYQYCNNACWNWGIIATHFFEIQADDTIIDITANLPGAVVPFFSLLHDNIPGTLYVYDRGYVGPGSTVNTWWIFNWNGVQYEDATSQYRNDIRTWGQNWLAAIREEYGIPQEWERFDFGRILLQYEKADLRNEAIEIITEITDISNWPESNDVAMCYMYMIRKIALEEYQSEMPFSLPPYIVGFDPGWIPECANISAPPVDE